MLNGSSRFTQARNEVSLAKNGENHPRLTTYVFPMSLAKCEAQTRHQCMKILLQRQNTGSILTRNGAWSVDGQNAWEFNSSAEAINYCVDTETREVNLILRFRQGSELIDVPLHDASFAVTPPITRVQAHFQRQHTVTSQAMAESW